MFDTQELLNLLQDYERMRDSGEDKSALRVRRLIESSKHFWKRTHFDPGHVTASAFITTHEHDKVLLVHHLKLNRWLQPGGHIEPEDSSIYDAVAREMQEETGLKAQCASKGIFHIDIHSIPARKEEPEHLHFDVRLHMYARVNDTIEPLEGESGHVKWVACSEISKYTSELGVHAMVKKL